jgi:hypothetical protein
MRHRARSEIGATHPHAPNTRQGNPSRSYRLLLVPFAEMQTGRGLDFEDTQSRARGMTPGITGKSVMLE